MQRFLTFVNYFVSSTSENLAANRASLPSSSFLLSFFFPVSQREPNYSKHSPCLARTFDMKMKFIANIPLLFQFRRF